MDDKQFAEITKAMGREVTRRGALGRLVAGVLGAAGLSRLAVRSAAAVLVEPTKVPFTPDWNRANYACTQLGYENGFKPVPETDDGSDNGVTWNFNGGDQGIKFVDWTSNFPMGAVVVKAGADFNLVYDYSSTNPTGGTKADTGLYADEQKNISHVIFCWNKALQVKKTANPSFDREWDWTINKQGDKTNLTLSTGQEFPVNYTIVVDATSSETNLAVQGNISIHNPNGSAKAIIGSLQDIKDAITQDGTNTTATVVCQGSSFPYTLDPGSTLKCTYSATLPNKKDGKNKVTVTTSSTSKVPGGSGEADVNFGTTPKNETDECVTVTDDQFGSFGQVCSGDAPKTFKYTKTFNYDVCGNYTFKNTATFVTNDTGTSGSDDHTVTVSVPCQGGCTLTQGYWKTHSKKGPAPYDETWAQIGENTTFFKSGQSYYQVMWTPPAGNAYYNLASQYVAAKLNILNGASAPAAVTAAITAAEALFNKYTPADIAVLKGSNAVRKEFVALASTLDQYNNGATGPGHCDENDASTSLKAQNKRKGSKRRAGNNRKRNGKGGKGRKGANGAKGKRTKAGAAGKRRASSGPRANKANGRKRRGN